MALLLVGVLVGCTPAVTQNNKGVTQPLLAAQATEKNGELTFQIINVSGHTMRVQSNYCFDQPKWEVKYANGNVYNPPLVENTDKSEIHTINTCFAVLITTSLASGGKIVIKRQLNMPSGSYTVRSWIRPVEPTLPGDGRLEAPIINVNIP